MQLVANAGLNYDRNIVQFYGVCLEEGEQPMLVCELMEVNSSQQGMCLPAH